MRRKSRRKRRMRRRSRRKRRMRRKGERGGRKEWRGGRYRDSISRARGELLGLRHGA